MFFGGIKEPAKAKDTIIITKANNKYNFRIFNFVNNSSIAVDSIAKNIANNLMNPPTL